MQVWQSYTDSFLCLVVSVSNISCIILSLRDTHYIFCVMRWHTLIRAYICLDLYIFLLMDNKHL